MKKRIGKFFICFCIILGCFAGCGKSNLYTIRLPDAENLSSVSVVSLSRYDETKIFSDTETMEEIYHVFQGRETKQESRYDNPVDAVELYAVTFENADEAVRIYIYRRDNKYYIEQPYNGIYKIQEAEFKTIRSLMG
ncbi:MAG: DUF5301 domain-containing protein [Anaerotignum sp.]|nr:DUF5301 domain-containing protein [Anaerotignum sp.]